MDRRGFLKALGLGCLIPLFKLEKAEADYLPGIADYYGIEGQADLKLSNTDEWQGILPDASNMHHCLKIWENYYTDQYEYFVARGNLHVENVYRDGMLVHPSEYLVHFEVGDLAGLTETFITFYREQRHYNGEMYSITAKVKGRRT